MYIRETSLYRLNNLRHLPIHCCCCFFVCVCIAIHLLRHAACMAAEFLCDGGDWRATVQCTTRARAEFNVLPVYNTYDEFHRIRNVTTRQDYLL